MEHRGFAADRRNRCSISCAATSRTKGSTRRASAPASHILGDIVYSAAVPVGAPERDPIPTPARRARRIPATTLSRRPRRAARRWSTSEATTECCMRSSTTAANGGKEAWAYIPKVLFSGGDPNDTAHTPSARIPARSALRSAAAGFRCTRTSSTSTRRARIWDVDFANTNTATPPSTGNDWRTMLVGGLGAGGRSVYALDVTNPHRAAAAVRVARDTEATAAIEGAVGIHRREPGLRLRRADARQDLRLRLGRCWSRRATTTRAARAFCTSSIRTRRREAGQLLKKIALPGRHGHRTRTRPDLATIRALHGEPAESVRAAGVRRRHEGQRLALRSLERRSRTSGRRRRSRRSRTPRNKPQPITTGVRIEIDQNNNVDRYLFVGTGKLLDQQDLVDTSMINSFYVIRDGNWTTPEPAPAIPYSRANLTAVIGQQRHRHRHCAHRSRVVPGRHRRQPQDQLRRLRGRQCRRVRLFEAVDGPVPVAAVRRRCMRAISRPATRCSSQRGNTIVAERRHRRRHRGRRAHPGGSDAKRRHAARCSMQVTTMNGQVESVPVQPRRRGDPKHRVTWGLVSP